MSDQPRQFPAQPNLRYLKLEAKRRLAAGEFTTLHDAQLAIAREHGRPSWAALKRLIESQPAAASPALGQIRWLVARFADAGRADWAAPGEGELREHFAERFLTAIPAERLVSTIAGQAGVLREELAVTIETPQHAQAQIGGLQIEAAAEPEPPHRLAMLRVYPIGSRVADPRVAAPSSRTVGDVPRAVREAADTALAELGLPGLVLAGRGPGDPDGAAWMIARGWADIDQDRPLEPGHQFPAYSITKLVTATTVLRLVADGAVRLNAPANDYLRTLRLADPTVTVRDLLAHTGGVDSPAELFADSVPALRSLTGPVLGCGGERGVFAYSNGGYAALGQLIADVSGAPYPEVVARLVLRPLGMDRSSFPDRWPDDADAVAGHLLEGGGSFQPALDEICTLPAAGGLWSTASDLVRFGQAWPALLPAELAREALRPQSERPGTGVRVGLGWHVNAARSVAGHAGGGQGGASSLIVSADGARVHVALTNRLIPIEPVNARVLWALDGS